MVAIGSLLFCDACGSLLPRVVPGPHNSKSGNNSGVVVQCEDCLQFTTDSSDKVVVSRSKAGAFPSALAAKHSDVQAVNAEELQVEAVINRTCPQCGRSEMFYHTKQLRSADEGSTVFYRCECGFKDVQNN